MDRIICFGVEVVVEVAVGCLVDLDDEDNDDERVVDLEKVNGRTLLLFTFIYDSYTQKVILNQIKKFEKLPFIH